MMGIKKGFVVSFSKFGIVFLKGGVRHWEHGGIGNSSRRSKVVISGDVGVP